MNKGGSIKENTNMTELIFTGLYKVIIDQFGNYAVVGTFHLHPTACGKIQIWEQEENRIRDEQGRRIFPRARHLYSYDPIPDAFLTAAISSGKYIDKVEIPPDIIILIETTKAFDRVGS